jgi:hypothetical protein
MAFTDDRDVNAFRNLLPEQKKAAIAKWGDVYTWYMCEATRTISVALREGFKPQELAQQYRLSIEAVNKCAPLKT